MVVELKCFFCVCFTIGAMTVFSRMRKVCSVVFDLERIALAFYHFECRRPQIIGFFFAVARVTRDASDLNLQLVSGRAPTLNMCIHPRFLWCFKRLSADERIDRFAATCDFQVDLSKVDPDWLYRPASDHGTRTCVVCPPYAAGGNFRPPQNLKSSFATMTEIC